MNVKIQNQQICLQFHDGMFSGDLLWLSSETCFIKLLQTCKSMQSVLFNNALLWFERHCWATSVIFSSSTARPRLWDWISPLRHPSLFETQQRRFLSWICRGWKWTLINTFRSVSPTHLNAKWHIVKSEELRASFCPSEMWMLKSPSVSFSFIFSTAVPLCIRSFLSRVLSFVAVWWWRLRKSRAALSCFQLTLVSGSRRTWKDNEGW